MKTNLLSKNLARLVLVAAAALSTSTASALTSYSSGDVFIGFRQTGVTDTLVLDLGSVAKFLPPSLGGTWNGAPFQVTFGLNPTTSVVVTNINLDLTAVFGGNWATNSTDGTSVRWAVVGITDNALDDSPIVGYNNRTAFVTKPRTDPATQSTALASISNNAFGSNFNSFANGLGQGSYVNQSSTANSSVAFRGDGTLANNWNTQLGATGTFGLGSGRVVEQINSGAFQGPTNSVLDFYVAPSSGSTLTSSRTFTGGSFTLNSSGVLTYGVVPEPGSIALLGFGLAVISTARGRKRSKTTVS